MLRRILPLLLTLVSASAFSSPKPFSVVGSKLGATVSPPNGSATPPNPSPELASVENRNEDEYANLDLAKTAYFSSVKSPKDAYISFAEKGPP